MNRSTRGSRRSPLWKDIFKTGRARNKPNENQSSNKLALPQELEDIMKNKKVTYTYCHIIMIILIMIAIIPDAFSNDSQHSLHLPILELPKHRPSCCRCCSGSK